MGMVRGRNKGGMVEKGALGWRCTLRVAGAGVSVLDARGGRSAAFSALLLKQVVSPSSSPQLSDIGSYSSSEGNAVTKRPGRCLAS